MQWYNLNIKEYVAYKGEKYTIEWYYTEKGESQPLEFFEKLPVVEQQKLFHIVKRLGDFGFVSDKTKFRNEGDDIYAMKPQPNRFLSFFYNGTKIIITNAFTKKSQKLRKRDKEQALAAKEDYIKRVKEGVYYEDE